MRKCQKNKESPCLEMNLTVNDYQTFLARFLCCSLFTARQAQATLNCTRKSIKSITMYWNLLRNSSKIKPYTYQIMFQVTHFNWISARTSFKANVLCTCLGQQRKDTKNNTTWWCLTAPIKPRMDIIIRNMPHAIIPPIMGRSMITAHVLP